MATLKRIVVGYRGCTPYFLTEKNRWARSQAKAATFIDDISVADAMQSAPKSVDSTTWLWATIISNPTR